MEHKRQAWMIFNHFFLEFQHWIWYSLMKIIRDTAPLKGEITLLWKPLGYQWQLCALVSRICFRVFGTLVYYSEHCFHITQQRFLYSFLKHCTKSKPSIVLKQLYYKFVLLIRPYKIIKCCLNIFVLHERFYFK